MFQSGKRWLSALCNCNIINGLSQIQARRESEQSRSAHAIHTCGLVWTCLVTRPRPFSADRTLRFFQMAFSSATELLHQLITSLDLQFIGDDEFRGLDQQLETVRRKLATLMNKMRPV